MTLVYFIFIACVLLLAERGILGTLHLKRLSARLFADRSSPQPGEARDLYVLIPVLREQHTIIETLKRFCMIPRAGFNIRLVVITTSREYGSSTTEQLIRTSLESGALAEYQNTIEVVRANDPGGNMASQLNFAVNRLSAAVAKPAFFMVYNADSRITRTTFDSLHSLLTQRSGSFAVQQPCAYVAGFSASSSGVQNAISVYQSWYCLAQETRLIEKYGPDGYRLGVITGHGSGMTTQVHDYNGGYPEELLTEDLTFGYILSANRVPIYHVPALEIAGVPDSLLRFIKQKRVWFWNYLGYISCFRRMAHAGHDPKRLLVLLAQGIAAGLYWLCSILFIVVPIVIGICYSSLLLTATALLSFALFSLLPQYILFKRLPGILRQQGFERESLDARSVSFASVFFPLVAINMVDSLGPWLAIPQAVRYVFTGRLPNKYKTGE